MAVKLMCRVLTVSEAGYYRYKRNCGKPSRDAVLSAAIKAIREESAYNDNYEAFPVCGWRSGSVDSGLGFAGCGGL